ncbi:E3 ubiquitin-protein ligase hecd-1 [Taenia crassiceps]|uniref:E3 ubiquitin-protein ligase n=1 Tax=Taenia crassiceps TaxID=6207 RepID=A0ABR4QQG4_9CEST
MNKLGLSSDLDIVSDVFHLWIKSAIIHKTSIVDILMAMNSVQIRTCWHDLEGRSLLASAVDCRYPSAMMALVNRGSDPNSGLKETPMHVAASQGDSESLRFLISLRSSHFGVATNPLLRNTLGHTPRDCCKHWHLAEMLRINEEEFQAQFEILRGGTAGQLMAKILPLIIRGYNASMNPLLRLQALRLITRVCRSCPGYAMINLTLKGEKHDSSRSKSTKFPLRTQLLNLITSVLNQGCISEACQILSLILALVDHPGVREGLQCHGVLNFLSWRLEAESLLKGYSQDVSEKAEKWTNYLPNDLIDPEASHHGNIENPYESGHLRARPQCIYEFSWDQTYQFGDWFVLRSGNSSVIMLQEYAALYIEVKPRQVLDHLVVPIIVATLFTRTDSAKGGETRVTPEIDHIGKEKSGRLEAKTIILCSSAEGGQIRDNEDATTQWLKCQACIMRICSCKEGVIPLPLRCFHEKTSSPGASHDFCSTPLCEREDKLLNQETDVFSDTLDPEAGVCITKKTSSAFCGKLNSEKKSASALNSYSSSHSADDPLFMAESTSVHSNPGALSLEHIQTCLPATESDSAFKESHDSKTKVNQLDRLTAGLLSVSISSSGLVVCLRETIGAERYLKALATANNEVVTCNHTECTGNFNPDFYQHFTEGWIEDQEEQRTAKQVVSDSVGLEKIVIAQSKSGGIRFYGTDGLLIYRANAFSRTARLQKLHPLLESLTLSQRKALRTFYRSCYLQKLRECFIQRGTELLETLKPIVTAEYSECMLSLMNMAKVCETITSTIRTIVCEICVRLAIPVPAMFERFPSALPNFGESYEQLVQRSIYLQPKLRDNSRNRSPSMLGKQLHLRKVDLSSYRIFTAPLVTFHQLRNWLQEKIDNSPWHMDALENMGFMHDVSQPDQELHLVPPLEIINTSGLQSHSFPMLNRPWIFIDTGVLLETSHYSIKVPILSGQWPRLQHWKFLASSDKKSWDLLSEHHIYPRGQTPSSYWGSRGERIWAVNFLRIPYRFYWLIGVLNPQFDSTEPPLYLNSEANAKPSFGKVSDISNCIEVQNIEFYGHLKSVCPTPKLYSTEGTSDYHVQIKPGTLVVLNNFQLPECYLKEIWPPSFENNVEASEASSLSLGLVLSRVESGNATVAWFKPIPNENRAECSSRVVIERSSMVEDDSGQPHRFIFPSQVTNHTSMIELAVPDSDNLALQIFVKNILIRGNLVNSMEEDCKLTHDTKTQNSTTSTSQLLGEGVTSQKKSGILETTKASKSPTSPIIFGRLVLPYYGKALQLGGFQFNISFYGSCLSSLWPLHNGLSSSSKDADNRLTAPHVYDILARGTDISNQSKIATLDANLPGFIPPFNSRSGGQLQPATIMFDPSEGEHELRGNANSSNQGLYLWLSWNRSDSSEEGVSSSNMKSVKTTIVPDLIAQQLFPNFEISFFHCWMEGAGVTEEFPGCGKLKRPISPILGNCQRTYTLNYSFDIETSELFEGRLHREDYESRIHSSVNELPLIVPHLDGTLGHKITGADLVEQCLSLLHILHDISLSSVADQQPPTSPFGNGIITSTYQLLFCPPDVFFSSRLRRKVQAFMENPWSVIQGAGNPPLTVTSGKNDIDVIAWCQMLMRKFHFLFPFSTRVDFWRVTSLGLSRSIVWLQQQQQKQTGGQLPAFGDISSAGTVRDAYYRSADVESNSSNIMKLQVSASDFGYLWGPSMLFNVTHANNWIEEGGLPAMEVVEPQYRFPYSQSPSLGFSTSIVTSSSSSQPFYNRANGLNMLGRLQREVASVPRPSNMEEKSYCKFWPSAVQLLTSHASRKQELEVGFENEEGTGLGPTMEFYALLSAELMRKSHYIWVADYDCNEKDLERDMKFAVERDGLEKDWRVNNSEKMMYVRPRNGLFPAAWPANALPLGTEERFRVLGIALAKCLQDQRRMDLHFSTTFLQLLVGRGKTETCELASRLEDFVEIYPEQGKFFLLCLKYLNCAKNNASTPKEREQLEVEYFSSKLSDLCLTMEFPSITTEFGQSSFRLEDSYDWDNPESCMQPQQNTKEAEAIDHENLEIYIKRSIDFAMDKGIRKQINALKDGFNLVFPLNTLAVFTPDEMNQLISGDTLPDKWSYEELLATLEPVAGYTRQSTGYLMLLEVLSNLTEPERKRFVKFVTGSPNLPPGGFRNLYPTIKVAKKDASAFGPYPSVNTCMHYLKLPEYDTAEQLKEKLLTATIQSGFFLN